MDPFGFTHAHGVGDNHEHQGGIADRGEIAEGRAIREQFSEFRGHLQGEPRLVGSAGGGQRQEPDIGPPEQVADCRHLSFAVKE
ncbi:MAG: hypothetical protein M3Q71_11220 [Chloroflexota bacterium]|nr:hypothetical protein [Chloroflexota bacterium]MDP9471220.1 hypothetical protein [Chloroflexota bacterium]